MTRILNFRHNTGLLKNYKLYWDACTTCSVLLVVDLMLIFIDPHLFSVLLKLINIFISISSIQTCLIPCFLKKFLLHDVMGAHNKPITKGHLSTTSAVRVQLP